MGSVIQVDDHGVGVTVTIERWNKTKAKIDKWCRHLTVLDQVDFKDLESDWGFLVYVARTLPP